MKMRSTTTASRKCFLGATPGYKTRVEKLARQPLLRHALLKLNCASFTTSVSKLNKHQLCFFLEALAPGLIKAHVNAPKNIIAVDTINSAAVNLLHSTASLSGLEVRFYLLRGKHTMARVIRDVNVAIDEGNFISLVSSTTPTPRCAALGHLHS